MKCLKADKLPATSDDICSRLIDEAEKKRFATVLLLSKSKIAAVFYYKSPHSYIRSRNNLFAQIISLLSSSLLQYNIMLTNIVIW